MSSYRTTATTVPLTSKSGIPSGWGGTASKWTPVHTVADGPTAADAATRPEPTSTTASKPSGWPVCFFVHCTPPVYVPTVYIHLPCPTKARKGKVVTRTPVGHANPSYRQRARGRVG